MALCNCTSMKVPSLNNPRAEKSPFTLRIGGSCCAIPGLFQSRLQCSHSWPLSLNKFMSVLTSLYPLFFSFFPPSVYTPRPILTTQQTAKPSCLAKSKTETEDYVDEQIKYGWAGGGGVLSHHLCQSQAQKHCSSHCSS